MTIHSFPVKDNTKKESLLSESSSKQTHTLSNYLTGQLPVIELPLHSAPSLVTLASTSTTDILKEYFGGERPLTLPQDTSDPRVFSRTHSSALSSTHSLQTTDSVDVSSSQSQTVMTSVIHTQSRDQIRKELIQNYDFLITLKAAQKGFSEAQNNLGLMYAHGIGVKQDDAQAVYWYRKAAEQDHSGAQFNLGLIYAQSLGEKQDYAQAAYWYRKAAEQGHARSQFNLGVIYENGLGEKQDDAQAVYWYRKAAEQGHARSQFNLGLMHQHGRGVKIDLAEAVHWYRKAAEQGHAGAQCNLGRMYAQGLGEKQDYAEAVCWYRKAAKQGHAVAQFNLGVMYENGRGVKIDLAEAAYWYRKAAQQDHPDAQCNLGWMYDHGRGEKQDQAQAVIWYRKAAEQGHAVAQYNIGKMYAKGKGVEVNDVEACNWYFKAAKNGSKDAQLELASHYQQGHGLKKDLLQATYWLLKSVRKDISVEIFLDGGVVAEDFYSDVIQCIPAALTTFPEFKYIKTINFQKIDLSEQDFWSIGQMIRLNPHLVGLNLKYQNINNDDALILSQSLAFNTTLTALIFDDEYDFDATIFDMIKASLAQNVVIAELREHMKGHLITDPDGLPIRVPYITRSDELPIEVLDIIVDDMIVKASKAGKTKEATIAAIDEFLLSVSRQTLKDDLIKFS